MVPLAEHGLLYVYRNGSLLAGVVACFSQRHGYVSGKATGSSLPAELSHALYTLAPIKQSFKNANSLKKTPVRFIHIVQYCVENFVINALASAELDVGNH